MVIATSTFACSVPAGANSEVDRLLLRIGAALNNGAPIDIKEASSAGDSTTISGSLCSENKFTGQTVELKSVGLVGTLLLLLKNNGGGAISISSGSNPREEAEIRSWLDAADGSLLAVLRNNNKTTAAAAATAASSEEECDAFCASVDRFLKRKSLTYLIGDGTYPTIADVVVAVAMAAYATTSSKGELPQQAYRLTQTVLQRLVSVLDAADVKKTLTVYLSTVKEGAPSTAPLPLIGGDDGGGGPAAKKAAPAPAAAATAPAPATTSSDGGGAADTPDDNPILKLLSEHGIEHEVYCHEPCRTAEDLVAKVPIPASETHTKNLFLRDKKHGHFLVTVRPDANVQTKELGKMLGLQGKTNLRLADEKILDDLLHVKPGCVGPLCVGLAGPDRMVKKDDDEAKRKEGVTFVLDGALFTGDDDSSKYAAINSHALRNDQSVKMTPASLKRYLDAVGVEAVVLDFPSKPAAGEGGAAAAAPHGGKAPANRPPDSKTPKQQQPQAKKGASSKQAEQSNKKTVKKGETLLALQWKKNDNFPMWYSDVIVLSEMISYYDISGCYILRPWSYKMWHLIQQWFDVQIEKMGVENAYFPLFVSQDRLEKEKDHVEGFAPEVAWVTKSGSGDLAKPIAVRPTSETIMYPAYSDWIKSHRDLPLKLNQWSNVVRWEFKYPTPFLRTREFLWQEGHTAHASFEDAEETVMQALELYRGVYEDLLAVPVVKGYKTEKEKFAGGYRTTTVEAYIAGSGRAIQGATSHNLGQNFGKMFDIRYQDEKGESQIVWQTSWGLTTRTIGVMVMVHGDDQGLVVPPRIAPLQVVIVPIISKKLTDEVAGPYCDAILKELQEAGIRVKYDNRVMYNPGWKYNHWEQKGVPIRLEVGPKDMETKSARVVVRHDRSSENIPVDGIGQALKKKLEEIQTTMFQKAKEARDSHVVHVTEWKDFVPNLEKNNLVLTPWCGGEHLEWEEWVKTTSREESLKARGEEGEDEQTATSVAAKTLCIPFDQPELPAGTKCIASGLDATCWVLWGRSY